MTDYHLHDKSISQLKTIVREFNLDIEELRLFGDLRKRETWEKIIEQRSPHEADQIDWNEATAEDCCSDQRVATYKGWDIAVYLPNGGIVAVSIHKDGIYWQASTEHLKAWMQIGRHTQLAKRFIDSREDQSQTGLDQVEAARQLKADAECREEPPQLEINAKLGYVPISFGKTLEQVMSGGKTVTRRTWQDSYAEGFTKRYLAGVTGYPVFNRDRRYGGQQIGIVSLLCPPCKERLMDMPDSDLAREGFPELSRTEFIDRFFEGNSELTVWVIRFKFMPVAIAA